MVFLSIRRSFSILAGFTTFILLSGTVYNFHDRSTRGLPITYEYETRRIEEYRRLSTRDGNRLLPSAAWSPLSLNECIFGMPAHYAPCVAQKLSSKKVLYAEELLYPAFEIRQPRFAVEEHKDRWRNAALRAKERGTLQDSGWLVYKGQSGQNFVFGNVSYTHPKRYDSWSPEACMGSLVSSEDIRSFDPEQVVAVPGHPAIRQSAIVVLSPDSNSFQHHLDRVTHILMQGSYLTFGEHPHVITGKRGTAFVDQLWEGLGYRPERVLHSQKEDTYAEKLIFSCRAVLVHPWLSLKTLEAFSIDYMKESSTRNKIVYMSRSNGRAKNGGRKVLNEPDLLNAIRKLLEERDKGEELVVFNEKDFATASDLFEWFNSNVMAVVGPHGGAMYHHRWAARGTLIIEFMPTSFTSMAIFEEASVLSQTYAAVIVEPSGSGGKDMIIDPEYVLSLLSRHLGVKMRRPRHAEHMGFLSDEIHDDVDDVENESSLAEDPLKVSYQWGGKELGL
ncbi:uncharacterized protein EV420DRAFT_82075 [Desarmillaria tabescens]|uniref:Glycosyltransferase 61 catalytic domain-containing protein n=1 Tax=Armillaria tabescens TaxID=1929756 RepID=A0AA39NQI4_ARMTA|nr:uncharacterized protein EV420DRAFT_82075 [Desarmillaria tabescens]KAK0469960.1 hypothetical protein EV420DRAFT_82075 [Desarmillaria tabescens]